MLRQTRHPFLASVLALALAVLPIASASAAPFSYDFGASAVDTADEDGGLFARFFAFVDALLGGGEPAAPPSSDTSDFSDSTTDEPNKDFGPMVDINGSN